MRISDWSSDVCSSDLLARHIVLVVLGQHLAGDEGAVGVKVADGDDALPLAEEVRQDAPVGDRHRLRTIGYPKGDAEAVGRPQHGALLDQAAKADAALEIGRAHV